MIRTGIFLRFAPTRLAEVLRIHAVPLVLAAAVTLLLIRKDATLYRSIFSVEMMTAALLACTAATLWVETQLVLAQRCRWRLGLGLAAAMLGALAYLWADEIRTSKPGAPGGLPLLFVLGAAVYLVPALGRGKSTQDFAAWFHQSIYAQIMAWIASWMLIGGICLALASIKEIFGAHWAGEFYDEVIQIGAVFGATLLWFVLLPDLRALAVTLEIPRAQRIISSYVLVPLAWLLLVLSYLYAGKALLLWKPISESVVLYTMAGLCAAGPLLHAMLYCHREQGTAWERAYFRWFFLLILVPALTIGIYLARVIAVHGLTEPRYWGVMLLCGLAGTSGYYLAVGAVRYRFQSAALALLLLVLAGFYSPWRSEVLAGKYKKAETPRVAEAEEEGWRYRNEPPERRPLRTMLGGTEFGGLDQEFSPDKVVIQGGLGHGQQSAQRDVWPHFRGLRTSIEGTTFTVRRAEETLVVFDLGPFVAREKAKPEETRKAHALAQLRTPPEERHISDYVLVQKTGPWQGTLAIQNIELSLMPDGQVAFDDFRFMLLLERQE